MSEAGDRLQQLEKVIRLLDAALQRPPRPRWRKVVRWIFVAEAALVALVWILDNTGLLGDGVMPMSPLSALWMLVFLFVTTASLVWLVRSMGMMRAQAPGYWSLWAPFIGVFGILLPLFGFAVLPLLSSPVDDVVFKALGGVTLAGAFVVGIGLCAMLVEILVKGWPAPSRQSRPVTPGERLVLIGGVVAIAAMGCLAVVGFTGLRGDPVLVALFVFSGVVTTYNMVRPLVRRRERRSELQRRQET
jgi:hypothetical protein